MNLVDLTRYLDGHLRVTEVQDAPEALNGLQVESHRHTVSRVAAAVDACAATIELAAAAGADLLLVHHGLFWG
ncbi:MAG: Nif3-like dinuclear metal center hexameric protein, partial [Candidatus Rokuibacteriota bacterium]